MTKTKGTASGVRDKQLFKSVTEMLEESKLASEPRTHHFYTLQGQAEDHFSFWKGKEDESL